MEYSGHHLFQIYVKWSGVRRRGIPKEEFITRSVGKKKVVSTLIIGVTRNILLTSLKWPLKQLLIGIGVVENIKHRMTFIEFCLLFYQRNFANS